MQQLQKYIVKNISILFLSMFMPLFAIASLIFLIKLATYTAVIQLTLFEMLKLYLFILPDLLFYTLPISFFIATSLTLYKLSNDNEMIVVFSLGVNPKEILKILFKPALFLSLLLLFTSFVVIPHTTTLSKNFIQYKKSEAKLNLSASQYGHKFGDWLLYIGKENSDKFYSDIFLFKKDKKEEVIIVAKEAEIINKFNILKLKLSNGQAYSYSKEKFTQLDFKTMFINDTFATDLITYEKPIKYWFTNIDKEKKKKWFIIYSILSFFPIMSLYLALSFGIIQTREQKTKIYLNLFIFTLIYYGLTIGLYKSFGYFTIAFVMITFWLLSYTIFRKKILKKF